MDFQLHHFAIETATLLAAAFLMGLAIGIPSRKILRRSFGAGAPVLAGAGGVAVSDDGIVEDVAADVADGGVDAAAAEPVVEPVADLSEGGDTGATSEADTEAEGLTGDTQSDVSSDIQAEIKEVIHGDSTSHSSEDTVPLDAVTAVDASVEPVAKAENAGSDKVADAAVDAPPAGEDDVGAGAGETETVEADAEDAETDAVRTVAAEVEGDDGEVIHSAPEDIAAKPRKRRFLGWLLD